MTERNELINDIQRLKAERNRLLEQIKEAEQWKVPLGIAITH